jgi:hypothetical protein
MLDSTWRKSTKCGSAPDCAEVRWRRASCDSSSCAEVAVTDGVIEIRNSNAPDAGTARFTQVEWALFIAGVKEGDFDV